MTKNKTEFIKNLPQCDGCKNCTCIDERDIEMIMPLNYYIIFKDGFKGYVTESQINGAFSVQQGYTLRNTNIKNYNNDMTNIDYFGTSENYWDIVEIQDDLGRVIFKNDDNVTSSNELCEVDEVTTLEVNIKDFQVGSVVTFQNGRISTIKGIDVGTVFFEDGAFIILEEYDSEWTHNRFKELDILSITPCRTADIDLKLLDTAVCQNGQVGVVISADIEGFTLRFDNNDTTFLWSEYNSHYESTYSKNYNIVKVIRGVTVVFSKQIDFKDISATDKTMLHKELVNHLHEVYVSKNHDYGDSVGKSFEKFGLMGVIPRLSDKMNRLEQLAQDSTIAKVKDETVEDTIEDAINYALMVVSNIADDEKYDKDISDYAFDLALDLASLLTAMRVRNLT